MGLSAQMSAFFDELRKIMDLREGAKTMLPPFDTNFITDANYGVKAAYAANTPAAPKVNGLNTSQLGNRGALQQATKRVQDAQNVAKHVPTTSKAVPAGPKISMPAPAAPLAPSTGKP